MSFHVERCDSDAWIFRSSSDSISATLRSSTASSSDGTTKPELTSVDLFDGEFGSSSDLTCPTSSDRSDRLRVRLLVGPGLSYVIRQIWSTASQAPRRTWPVLHHPTDLDRRRFRLLVGPDLSYIIRPGWARTAHAHWRRLALVRVPVDLIRTGTGLGHRPSSRTTNSRWGSRSRRTALRDYILDTGQALLALPWSPSVVDQLNNCMWWTDWLRLGVVHSIDM